MLKSGKYTIPSTVTNFEQLQISVQPPQLWKKPSGTPYVLCSLRIPRTYPNLLLFHFPIIVVLMPPVGTNYFSKISQSQHTQVRVNLLNHEYLLSFKRNKVQHWGRSIISKILRFSKKTKEFAKNSILFGLTIYFSQSIHYFSHFF